MIFVVFVVVVVLSFFPPLIIVNWISSQNKFDQKYFDSLLSQKSEIESLASEFVKTCSEDGDDEFPKGDSDEKVLTQLWESYDILMTTVNDCCNKLATYVALWRNYNSTKEVVQTTIEEVQNAMEEMKERSHDPAIPPTVIVENAKVCYCAIDNYRYTASLP